MGEKYLMVMGNILKFASQDGLELEILVVSVLQTSLHRHYLKTAEMLLIDKPENHSVIGKKEGW